MKTCMQLSGSSMPVQGSYDWPVVLMFNNNGAYVIRKDINMLYGSVVIFDC